MAWIAPAWCKAPACPAFEQLRPMLNSERIQACFGSYGVEVLEQQGNLRISSLYSHAADEPANGREQGSLLHLKPVGGSIAADIPLESREQGSLLRANTRITRTLAISEFATDLPAALQAPYEAIREGASMGATLEAAGWRVDKRHRYVGEVPASATLRCMSGLPAETTQELAVQVYDLWVARDQAEIRFALLAELHDPRYLTLQDLQQIYPGQAIPSRSADEASLLMLQRAAEVCAGR